MKSIFTVHEGEFLVGDYINRKFGRELDVWVPTKDDGVDLLVTRREDGSNAVRLQVKYSRDYDIPEEHVVASSWYKLDPAEIRASRADLWIFVISTFKHKNYFVVIPREELARRIPDDPGKKWNIYLWVGDDGTCTIRRGARAGFENISAWLNNWESLRSGARMIEERDDEGSNDAHALVPDRSGG